jgi:hypothetical protein
MEHEMELEGNAQMIRKVLVGTSGCLNCCWEIGKNEDWGRQEYALSNPKIARAGADFFL